MLLTAARFPSRVDEHGDLLRLDDQDRSKWDQSLIERGLSQLVRAAQGNEVSEYHLQAGIAAIHCTAADYASPIGRGFSVTTMNSIASSLRPSWH